MSQSTIAQNVTGTLPSTGYTVFPGVTVPLDTYSMAPVSNTCSTNTSAPYITQVNECASRMETCCLDQFDFNGNQLVGDHFAEAKFENNCKLVIPILYVKPNRYNHFQRCRLIASIYIYRISFVKVSVILCASSKYAQNCFWHNDNDHQLVGTCTTPAFTQNLLAFCGQLVAASHTYSLTKYLLQHN